MNTARTAALDPGRLGTLSRARKDTHSPMSIQPDTSPVPEWDVADRMRKALRVASMTPGQMAEYLDVGGNTVSTWINGRINPSKQTLRLWALRTGVSFQWLSEGIAPTPTPGPDGGITAGHDGGNMSTSTNATIFTLRAINLAKLARTVAA